YEEGGQLTEAVRRKPYSIVLFDEIEKAHPDVFNILLQVLDDGRLTDSKGRTVDFKNTILIMTSNLGSEYLLKGNTPKEQEQVKELLKASFKPEFLNRIDDIIMFNSLSKDVIYKVAEKFLLDLRNRLAVKNIKLEYSSDVVNKIISDSYDSAYGARPIRRYIQQNIETLIAEKILLGDITDCVNISIDKDQYKIN
ncbi:MAG TPA: type VI secretion system ATPase TssH, partial [Firmicutes bacterium]|nr:type VI secretion system ATPase TssH [Bacillota bacterium]